MMLLRLLVLNRINRGLVSNGIVLGTRVLFPKGTLMLCSVIRLAVLVEIFAIAAFASAQEWDANKGPKLAVSSDESKSEQASKNDADGVSSLIVTGDFNRDGLADIARITSHAAASSESDHLTVLLGQTDGTFRAMVPKPVPGYAPRAMVGGDFNNDGIPDLIVGDEDGTLTLFLGDGTGDFNPVQQITGLSSVVSIAVADFNKDGILDIAVSDWRTSSVTVLLGAGKGSFDHIWSFPLRMRGTTPHIATADFNGDGVPDLAVVYDQEEEDTFDVLLGNGNGTFTIAPERGSIRNPNSHCNTL